VRVRVPAKVNLHLAVGPLRRDGYHELVTVFHAVDLYDELVAAPGERIELAIIGDGAGEVPADERNLAWRAATLLADRTGAAPKVRLEITKAIPVAGGMAGGSADAAAALVACDRLWRTGLSRTALSELAAELGSDVPFALLGGTAIGSGRGEVVTPLMTSGEYWWVVLESDRGLSTPEVYREFDRLSDGTVDLPVIPDALMMALRGHDVADLGAALSNDLQPAALRLRPELGTALEQGRLESAFGAILSGSGPSCLFLCEGRSHATAVAAGLGAQGLGPVSFAPGPVHGARVVARSNDEAG